MNYRRALTIVVLACMFVFQAYVIFNHETFWTAYPAGDTVLHFGWGLLVFLVLREFFQWRSRDALVGALVVAFWWEAAEMASERLSNWSHQDYFYFEGLYDVFWNAIGALVGMALLARRGIFIETSLARASWWVLTGILPVVLLGGLLRVSSGESPDILYIYWVVAWSAIVALLRRFTSLLWHTD